MEAKYFVHLSLRLRFLPDDAANRLGDLTGQCFACLHGLIQAVERESGRLAKVTATITAALTLALAGILGA